MYIVGTKKGETAVNLAFHLKNCEGGYEIPEDVNFLVNYGRNDLRGRADLNDKLINNKYTQLEKFKEAGLKIPKMFPINWNNSRSYIYPLIARKYFHCKGTDAIFIKSRVSWLRRKKRINKRNYFIEYIPKETEFRVHVCGEDIISISTKIKLENSINHPHIWSRNRGWLQVDYEGNYCTILGELGIKSIKALNYDFGAVDIILGKDSEFYILEVNSAPRLNRRRRKLYCDFFRSKYKEKLR